MKSWNGYEIVDEKARKDIEKLQLLTGGEAVNAIADYNNSKATAIVSTLKGEVLNTNSSAAIPPRNIKLFGKSIQNGEPSINNPQEIQSLGSGGSICGKLIGENLIDVDGIYVTDWGVYQENGTHITVDGDKVTIEVLKNSNDIIIPLLKPTHSFCCSLTYTFSDGVEANTRPFSFRTNDDHIYGDAQIPGTVIQFGSPEDTPIYRIGIGVGSSGGYFAVGTTITLSQSYLNETGNGFTPYIATQPFTFQTPNGLRGIPVSSGGNYTDSDGQQYVADYVDLERGKYVHNVFRVNMTPDLPWKYTNTVNSHNHNFQIRLNVNDFPKGTTRYHYVIGQLFSHFRYVDVSWDGGRFSNGAKAYFYDDELTISFEQDSEINSLETWKQFLTDNDVYGEYILAEPIETDITAEEIAQYKSLCMNYPNTTIINDENAYMEVEYVEDTKIYIDKLEKKHDEEIQTLKTAIIALGGTI